MIFLADKYVIDPKVDSQTSGEKHPELGLARKPSTSFKTRVSTTGIVADVIREGG
jgi:hypothetical protein